MPNFEFINELTEARLFKNPTSLEKSNTSAVADSLFAMCLALQILRYTKPDVAKEYSGKTMRYNLEGWRSFGSDLNNLVQLADNTDRFQDKLNVDRVISVPILQMKQWLRNISKGKIDERLDMRFFQSMQRQLGIKSSSLTSSRRYVSEWSRSSGDEKILAITRVNQILQHSLQYSDLFAPFAKVASKKGAIINQKDSNGLPLWAKIGIAGAVGWYIGKEISKKR